MIGASVPGVANALQVTIPGRSPSVPSVKALGNARDEKKKNVGSIITQWIVVVHDRDVCVHRLCSTSI